MFHNNDNYYSFRNYATLFINAISRYKKGSVVRTGAAVCAVAVSLGYVFVSKLRRVTPSVCIRDHAVVS